MSDFGKTKCGWGRRLSLLLVAGMCATCLFYASWLGVIACGNPEYLRDFHEAVNPDTVTYLCLGENIWQEGVYSRSVGEPWVPDFKWTPVYPFLAGGVYELGGIPATLVLNILMTLVSAWLLARLGFRYTQSRKMALFLFALPILDPLVWSVNLQAMSDAMFLFWLILGAYWTFPVLYEDENRENKKVWKRFLRLGAGGIAFSLAILTRPTGLYVPIVLLLAFPTAWGGKMLWKWLRKSENKTVSERNSSKFWAVCAICVFLGASFLPVGAWMARNEAIFGKFALCGNQNIVMVYYTGGGAWQMALGGTLLEAQTRISEEFDLPPDVYCQNPEAFGLDQGTVDTLLAKHKRAVIFRYPGALVKSACVGVPKSLLAHETRTLWAICGKKNPENVGRKELYTSWIFVWSIIFQGTLLTGTGWTIARHWREMFRALRKKPTLVIGVLGLGAYFVLTMMLSGMDCCARYRLPLMPIFYWVVAWKLSKILSLRQTYS